MSKTGRRAGRGRFVEYAFHMIVGKDATVPPTNVPEGESLRGALKGYLKHTEEAREDMTINTRRIKAGILLEELNNRGESGKSPFPRS